jgi:excisionase family DNA binding protein
MAHPNVTGRRMPGASLLRGYVPAEQAPQGISPGKRVLTVEEYMEFYGPGRTTTYELINSGRLKAVKLGRRTYILRDSADELLASLPALETATAA